MFDRRANSFEDSVIGGMLDSVPIIGISRHRLLTDGEGITTLVAFHGCPLSCYYCLNPQCRETKEVLQYINPHQLYNRVKIDDVYFQSTGGGIVFGGGEPLLYSKFIKQFYELCQSDNWRISIETSLNVNSKALLDIMPIIDEFIVDIKDMNPSVYMNYTGVDNTFVIQNLKLLLKYELGNKVVIRIPRILGFNDREDVAFSIEELERMGFYRFDVFKYVINKEDLYKGNKHIGKAICKVLKHVRKKIAVANDICYSVVDCHSKGHCSGTCPKCEEELSCLSEKLSILKATGFSIKL